MIVCFLEHTVETMCRVGATCADFTWFSGPPPTVCNITGVGVSLARNLLALALPGAPATAECVQSLALAPARCDIVIGALLQSVVYDSSWTPGAAYDADLEAIMRRSPPIGPWAFLLPLSPATWACVIALACVVVPLVSSVVEFDKGESLVANFKTYLVSSVHAFCGVDTMHHEGDDYSRESALLSTVVAIVGRVLTNVYGCNLVAFVITNYFDTGSVLEPGRFDVVSTTWDPDAEFLATFANRVDREPTDEAALQALRRGEADAVVAPGVFLSRNQRCGEDVNRIPGPRLFSVLAYSPGFEHARAVNDAVFFTSTNGYEPARRPPRLGCPPDVQSIDIRSVYGLVAAFAVCIGCVAVLAALGHRRRCRWRCRPGWFGWFAWARDYFGGPVNAGHAPGLTDHVHPAHSLSVMP